MKALLIIYIVIAFLYFCLAYKNTYDEIKLYSEFGFKPKHSTIEILLRCIGKAIIFPFDFLLVLLRG